MKSEIFVNYIKQRHMKTNFKVLAAAVALMAVASCEELPGGGIDNGGDNGGNGAPAVNTLPSTPAKAGM